MWEILLANEKTHPTNVRCVFGQRTSAVSIAGITLLLPHQRAVLCVDLLHLTGIDRFQKTHVQSHTSLGIRLIDIDIGHMSDR